MADIYTLPLDEIVNEFKLEVLYTPCETKNILIKDNDVNRPGLQLMGLYGFNQRRRKTCKT